MRRLGFILVALLFGGLYLGPSLYLDFNGIDSTATVVDKEERIDRGRRSSSLDWWRRLDVVVEYQPAEQSLPHRSSIRVDEGTYDRLQVGDTVRIRYQPEQWMRDFILLSPQARLEHQSTLQLFEPLLSPQGRVALLGGLLLVLLVLAGRARTRPGRAVFFALAALAGAALLLFQVRPAALFDTGGPRVSATATVRAVASITDRPASRRGRRSGSGPNMRKMAQPIERVQLDVGEGGSTVLAVDDIDARSVPGLAVGSRVAVMYPPDRPREARNVDATRTHTTINRLDMLAQYSLVIGFSLILILVGWLWERRRRGRQRLPLPQPRGP